MASKGVCCAAQAAGDLGKPIVLTLRKKDGTTYQRCGTCEVGPSCHNPQKIVFLFRFLPNGACGIAGTTHCQPTAAGIAQYNATRSSAAAAPQARVFYSVGPSGNIGFQTGSVVPGETPYSLPPS